LPELVEKGLITAEWALLPDPAIRWGDGSDRPDDVRVRALAEALLEEPYEGASDAEIAAVLDAGVALEPRYRAMIKRLRQDGSKLVLCGSKAPAKLAQLRTRFKSNGFELLGPSPKQISYCSALIRKRVHDFVGMASDLLRDAPHDDALALVQAYREVFDAQRTDAEAEDAFSKDKGAINDTSLVTSFVVAGVQLIFTGDMQLEEPEVSDERIVDAISTLRERIRDAGPFHLAKLSHHGSYNGFSEELWEDFGRPKLIGICTGSESQHHPNAQVLNVLSAHKDDLKWARTDRNGRVTFEWKEVRRA
jgi:hypothetical protein